MKNFTKILLALLLVASGNYVIGQNQKIGENLTITNQTSFSTPNKALTARMNAARKAGNRVEAQRLMRKLNTRCNLPNTKYVPNPEKSKSLQTHSLTATPNNNKGNGNRWSDYDIPVMVSNEDERHPSITSYYSADTNQDIFVAGEYWSGSNPHDINIVKSSDNGSTWLSSYSFWGTSTMLSWPSITHVITDTIGVAYESEWSVSDHDIWITKVDSTFPPLTPDIVINDNTTNDFHPEITSDVNYYPDLPYLYVIYYEEASSTEDSLMFQRSEDGGNTWTVPSGIYAFTPPAHASCSISFVRGVSANNLTIAYTYHNNNTGHDAIMFEYSYDYGDTWSDMTPVSSPYNDCEFPKIAALNDSSDIVFFEYWYSTSDRDIEYNYTTDYGATWHRHTLVNSDDNERFPTVAYAGGDYVYSAYTNLTQNQVLYSKANIDSLDMWYTPQNIKQGSNAVSDDDPIALLVQPDTSGTLSPCVSWSQLYNSNSDYDIYFNALYFNPPVADFIGTPTSGTVPLTVAFTDQSSNNPTSWSWDFGDGNTSTLQNPSHTYQSAGTYTVSLTVSNDYGSDTRTKTNYITAGNIPIADFTGTPTSGTAPLTVNFTDQSSNNPTSWSWDFGDGHTSTQQNPQHIYQNAGTYTVSLTATNQYGSDTETKTDYITAGNPPVADFSGTPTSGAAPLTVSFTDQSSNNPTSWSWDFGDGHTSTQQNPQHIYQNAGTYTVSLTATNQYGSNTETKTDYITAGNPPVADFSGTPTSGDAPLLVTFTDLSSNNPTSWSWDFGDGNTSTQQNPTHTYQNAGTYTVTLTATNQYGSDTEIKTNYIIANTPGNPPIADFSGTPTTGPAPLTVAFTDQSSNNPTSWSWDFGDGNTSTQQNPSHTYQSNGNYTVKLTVSNQYGSDSITKTDYISVGDEPVADFVGTPTSGAAPLTVNFTDQSTNNPTSWSWDFGDGGTSTLQNPSHIYQNAGTYTVALTATNNFGSSTETKTGYITVGNMPTADFSGSPTTGNAPLDVTFTDQSGNNPTSWLWDFGDGNTSTQQNPNHTYQNAGTYSVALTASNQYGSNTRTKANYIIVNNPGNPPIANFSGDPTSGAAPLTVTFTDQSSNTPTSWNWDFGDGGTSTLQNPSHSYQNSGNYSVTLTAINQFGSNTLTKASYIAVGNLPVADFSGDPTSGSSPLTVNFTDQSTNNPTAWSWDFGDGGLSTQQNPTHIYQSEGFYTVSLIATNQYGSNTNIKTNYIHVTSDYITVTNPNGGENWQVGTVHSITWNDNIAENVKIQLDKSGVLTTITNSTTSNGTYAWTIPTDLQNGSDYLIRITSVDNANIFDVSDSYFTISSQSNLSVTPNQLTLTGDIGSSATFDITSNIAWQISGYPTWLDLNTLNGSDDATVTVTANSANNTGVDRTAQLSITGNGVPTQNVNITQEHINGITEEQLAKSVSIYPNPAKSIMYIQFSAISIKNFSLSIYDVYGNKLFNKQYDQMPVGAVKIYLANYTSGVYHLHVNNDTVSFTKQFIVIK